MTARIRTAVWSLTIPVLLFPVFAGCSATKTTEKTAVSSAIDNTRTVSKQIFAKDGGSVVVLGANGARTKIIFPRGALSNNTPITAAPLSRSGLKAKAPLVSGFWLEQTGTGKGPALRSPALVTVTLRGKAPRNLSIVAYHEDGNGYDVIPTATRTARNVSMLSATLLHFSRYGVMPVSNEEAKSARDEAHDYNWVIYVSGTNRLNYGSMHSTISIKMRAVNTSGDIEGKYLATGSSQTTNEMTSAGGHVSAPAASRIPPFSFDLAPYFAPLAKEEEPAPLVSGEFVPAPLVPNQADFSAKGSLNISSAGTGTVYAGGGAASAPFSTQTTVTFTLTVNGPTAEMTVDVPQIGQLHFNGYIRGEGKK